MLTCKLILEGTPEEVASFLATPGAKTLTALTAPSADKAMMTTALQTPPNPGHQQIMAMPSLQHDGNQIGSHTADDDGPINSAAPSADTAGIPWDDRIHSKNKNANADGTWRKKRGVDGAMVAAVEAELKMRNGGQHQPPAMPQIMPQIMPPSSSVPMPMPEQQFQPQYQQPNPAPQYQQPPQGMPNGQYMQPPQGMPNGQYTQPPAPVQLDFTGFMQQLSGQMAKRDQNGQPLIHTDYLASVVQRLTAQFGRQFNSITDVSGDPNAINAAVALITADGRWN